MNFENLQWHDALIESIQIDRSNPGYSDEIVIYIQWPDDTRSKAIFSEVFQANFNLNFGVIADECILEAYIHEDDEELIKLKSKWAAYSDDYDAIKSFFIKTSATGSSIRIYAKLFNISFMQ